MFCLCLQTISILKESLFLPLFSFSYTTTTSASSERSSLPTTTTPMSRWPTRGCTSAWVRTAKQKEETEYHPPWRWHISCQEFSGLINRLHLNMETGRGGDSRTWCTFTPSFIQVYHIWSLVLNIFFFFIMFNKFCIFIGDVVFSLWVGKIQDAKHNIYGVIL